MRELQAHVHKIEARMARYSAEKAQALASLSGGGDAAPDERREALVRDVVAHLDGALASLCRSLVRKQDRLSYYDHLDVGATDHAGGGASTEEAEGATPCEAARLHAL